MSKAHTTIYSIELVEGRNQGITGDAELRDVFVLHDANQALFRITYTCDPDAGIDSMKVERLTDLDAWSVPYVAGPFDLAYKVYDRLMMLLFDEEGEFLKDIFTDEEGNAKRLPMQFTPA